MMLVLEFCDGGSLKELIATTPLPESRAGQYTAELLSALDYLHLRTIAHRDVKPSNCLLKGSHLKLADFGSAGWVSRNDDTTSFPGSLAYMAPEVARKKRCGRKADIWSLGCTVLELLTKRRIFDGTSDVATLKTNLINMDKAPELPSGISESARSFLGDCLVVDADRRPSSLRLLEHSFVSTVEFTDGQSAGLMSPSIDPGIASDSFYLFLGSMFRRFEGRFEDTDMEQHFQEYYVSRKTASRGWYAIRVIVTIIIIMKTPGHLHFLFSSREIHSIELLSGCVGLLLDFVATMTSFGPWNSKTKISIFLWAGTFVLVPFNFVKRFEFRYSALSESNNMIMVLHEISMGLALNQATPQLMWVHSVTLSFVVSWMVYCAAIGIERLQSEAFATMTAWDQVHTLLEQHVMSALVPLVAWALILLFDREFVLHQREYFVRKVFTPSDSTKTDPSLHSCGSLESSDATKDEPAVADNLTRGEEVSKHGFALDS